MKTRFDKARPYLYLAPAMLFFALFVLWPLVYTVYLSFFDWNMVRPTKEFVGLTNYVKVFTDPYFGEIFGNTILYILILLFFNFVVAFLFSFLCHFVLTRFQAFFKTVFFLPSFISLVVASMVFVWILNPITGPVSKLVALFGVVMPVWSTTESLVVVVISLITSWQFFGYNFVTLYAAVGGVSKEVIEAARLDNIPLHRIFLQIVVPMSGSSGYYVFIMTIVQGLQLVYTPIEVITRGGPDYASSNLIYQAYFEAFGLFKTGYASALSLVILVFFALLTYFLGKVIGRKVYYEN